MAIFSQDRDALRQQYHDVWQKMQSGQILTALEQLIADVIVLHPEYHNMLSSPIQSGQEYFVENGQTNPYLHMGLHIAVLEQLSTDRPAGIVQAYQRLIAKTADEHQAQHMMIDCLAEQLWLAQQNQQPPSETAYLNALQRLTEK
ncbi:DUF1841 family protein [Methylophaga sp.]|uniref:DUF1841 family protein n=1 Tax=Methylophaga sp. TaxID=2024840 RepID=UPI000C0D1A76|nr:DUF1841 family protein [Methylophaga sp.]MBL1456951.1 DUF1841 family protein [Methylophaga sp.]|tara:strand:+ start:8785 stop:9219 length:435 start_codon:yes stop_codon:yes gene_type:complete